MQMLMAVHLLSPKPGGLSVAASPVRPSLTSDTHRLAPARASGSLLSAPPLRLRLAPGLPESPLLPPRLSSHPRS